MYAAQKEGGKKGTRRWRSLYTCTTTMVGGVGVGWEVVMDYSSNVKCIGGEWGTETLWYVIHTKMFNYQVCTYVHATTKRNALSPFGPRPMSTHSQEQYKATNVTKNAPEVNCLSAL